MAVDRWMPSRFQTVDTSGDPYTGARLFFYTAGTSTKRNTFTDDTGATPNTNPIVLGSDGRPAVEIWLTSGEQYKVGLAVPGADDPPGSFIWTEDDVRGINVSGDLANTSSLTLGDALVGVKLDATGAVARTQHSKNAETVSVDDFGAVGDGSTDDSAALLLAINTAKPVRLSSGKTYIIDTVAPAGDVYLVGDRSATLKHKGTASAHMIRIAGSKSFYATGMRFDGNTANQSTDRDLVQASTGLNCYVNECDFVDSSNRAIGFSGTGQIAVSDSTFKDCDNYPIQIFSGNAKLLLVDGCTFTYDAAKTPVGLDVRAIQPASVETVIVTGCYMDLGRKYRDGIWMNACEFVSISGNTILETEDDQITFAGTTGKASITGNVLAGSNTTGGVLFLNDATGHHNVTISGNHISDCVTPIYCDSVQKASISGNSITSADEGVRLVNSGTINDIVIVGNVFTAINDYAVDCGAASRVQILNNRMIGTDTVSSIAIHCRNASDVKMHGNYIGGFVTHIQTGKGYASIRGNTFSGSSGRSIDLTCPTANDLSAALIDGNEFLETTTPIVATSAKGIKNCTINGNIFRRGGADSGNAIDMTDGIDFVVSNNIFDGFSRSFVSSASSDRLTYCGNNSNGCTNLPSFTSLTSYTAQGNIPPTNRSGSSTQSGTGAAVAFNIAHGFTGTPTSAVVVAGSDDARALFKVTVNGTNIVVTYAAAPANATDNLIWYWLAEKQ